MRIGHALNLTFGAGIGALVYGGLFGLRDLKLEHHRLDLPSWPEEKDGYRIAVLADPHVRDPWSVRLMQRAILMAIESEPDVICLLGDYISYWRSGALELVEDALAPLADWPGPKLAVPGNHDSFSGDPKRLVPLFDRFGIELLFNEHRVVDGVVFIGLESALEGMPDPMSALQNAPLEHPVVCLWHEPDWADLLPEGIALALSGHTHGGQFLTPWGWAPGLPTGGKRFVRGFFPDLPVPLYVSRGIGTTGPPSRLFCPGEVTLLRVHASKT
ncbi:MAG: metallophosphoesterase [Fimbriimonadaceae bacterium]|nr:metallophosphoesterase [Fimbriimonadaceae bacterium]